MSCTGTAARGGLAALLLVLLTMAALPAWTQTPGQLAQWQVSPAGAGVSLRIAGIWPDSCNPGAPMVSRDGFALRLHMQAGPAPGYACFAAMRPWQHDTVVTGLSPGTYTVQVSYELRADPGPVHDMGGFQFAYPLAPTGTVAQGVPLGSTATWLLLVLAMLLAAGVTLGRQHRAGLVHAPARSRIQSGRD